MRPPPIKHASKYGVIKLCFRKRSHTLAYEQKGGYQSTADCNGVSLDAHIHALSIAEVAAEPLIDPSRNHYPNYYDYLSIIFSNVKQKPRVVEEHDSAFGIISAVEAGIGVAIGADVLVTVRKPSETFAHHS